MPSPEARLKKNKCLNCFDCPSCMHTLSTRATSVQIPAPDDPSKTVPKKVYYLVCGFCRWTSRDVGIPDQTTASGGWQEKENPQRQKIYALMEHYRLLAQKEKLEKEKKKMGQRCNYLHHYPDRYGISSSIARKLACASSVGTKDDSASEVLLIPKATSEVEALPEKFLTEPLNLATVCTLDQMLFQPQFQPVNTSELFPQQKYLLIKRSQRCKECEHNLIKPEYNPNSIKFKIQLAAYYHIPVIRIKYISPLVLNQECKVELTLCNPTPHSAHISFTTLPETNSCASVNLPTCEFSLPPRDDTAEFDDTSDVHQYQDDPQIVSFRKSNKIGFYINVTPEVEGKVQVSFEMKHDFVNMVVQMQSEQREPQVIWMKQKVVLTLGQTVTTAEK